MEPQCFPSARESILALDMRETTAIDILNHADLDKTQDFEFTVHRIARNVASPDIAVPWFGKNERPILHMDADFFV